jgi:hypothetical protein
VADELGTVALDAVETAILSELGGRYRLHERELDAATLELATRLEAEHRIDVQPPDGV